MKSRQLVIRASRPFFLGGGILMYALGVAIASYLGKTIDLSAYLTGQVWVTLLQLSTHYFNEYYDSPADQANNNRTILTGGSGAVGPNLLSRRTMLLAGLTCLAFLASTTVILVSSLQPGPAAYVIMVLAFLGSFYYSTPPVRLEATGYGEVTATLLVTFLLPAFAYYLQTGELHRLLAMTSFPLAALMMAMLIAFELPDFVNDLKYEKNTLLVRLGWQTGISMHNILILTAFLLLLLARLFGYPLFAMVSGMLPLPLALFQIWQMRSIVNGAKPNWNGLTIVALSLFALTAYLLAYAFWVN